MRDASRRQDRGTVPRGIGRLETGGIGMVANDIVIAMAEIEIMTDDSIYTYRDIHTTWHSNIPPAPHERYRLQEIFEVGLVSILTR